MLLSPAAVPARHRLRSGHSDIRLLFVTPEKVASSGNFQGLLRQLHADGRLARVVVDEAHCVSQVSGVVTPCILLVAAGECPCTVQGLMLHAHYFTAASK